MDDRLTLKELFDDLKFLQKLAMSRADLFWRMENAGWEEALRPLWPVTERISCRRVLECLGPALETLAPEPEEGWPDYTYQVAVSLLYPRPARGHTDAQRDAALCVLHSLRALLDQERAALPFDPWLDFAFCTEEELSDGGAAGEYRQFLGRWREEYVYELLRLGREITPFRTLDHIAGVHHVAMTVGRAFKAGGGRIDLGLMSGAAAGHDLGKFGCRPGERVPYLHYYYTDQWFSWRGLPAIGLIAANHSVWDLEIENLSAESLVLVYADFRVKQSRDPAGQEVAQLFSLREAFDVILNKLDNVDDAKRRRYQYVYTKLQDFEDYLISFGVDTELTAPAAGPVPRRDTALMTPEEVVRALRHTAVDHNIRLMHRLGRERLFVGILEAARGEKTPARIRAYLSIFEEYFTYWSTAQKEQTLEFLYELLLTADGGIRRQAAHLMGCILADFLSGYRKELPAGVEPRAQEVRPFELWEEYLTRLILPDTRLTPRQTSRIRYQAKLAADALLEHCAPSDAPRFAQTLFRHCRDPRAVDPEAAFALLDTVLNVPLEHVPDLSVLAEFAVWWLERGEAPQKAAAMRLFRRVLPGLPEPVRRRVAGAVERVDCGESTALRFLKAKLGYRLDLPETASLWARLDSPEAVSGVFLDNLKTATPWVLKAVGVEYLLNQTAHNPQANLLHIAAHLSNLLKVSEHVVVRRMAGAALLEVAPQLTVDRRNEIAVELSKALESGQTEISQYIPACLGQFALWLPPRELDELLEDLISLLASPNTGVAAAALSTMGTMLEHYAVYPQRFSAAGGTWPIRRREMAAQLLKGLALRQEDVRQEALHILGGLFASQAMSEEDRTFLFTLTAKKILFLIGEQPEEELTFFYTAAALSHIYRFLVRHGIESGPFQFRTPEKAAFFPGTFDPFSLSHKGIVRAIRDLGFEVYLAVDEFSWSKKAQPSLIRRQIVSMSVADAFDVYLFPHNIPVNLASPEDLDRLREIFAGRELYLTVGSDVVAGASSYKAPPAPGSVHFLNHIVFRRSSDAEGREIDADLSRIQGDVIQLQLPTHLEDISSTRIRENIDLGRDISNLIDPAVQDFIFQDSLYLREPQYKQIIRTSYLDFSFEGARSPALLDELRRALPAAPPPEPQDELCILRDISGRPRVLGYLTLRTVNSAGLYEALGSEQLANEIRVRTAGRIRLLTGLYAIRIPEGTYDIGQLLLTEVLSRAMEEDCSYAVWRGGSTRPETVELLKRQGFVPAGPEEEGLLLVDMRAPAVVLQNVITTLKEPLASDVLPAARMAHLRFQQAVCGLYPGNLVLSLNAEVIYHRLVRKITELGGVPAEPVQPRVLGPLMCVPFGKILRGNAVPNTVTKTIHTDKVFAADLKSFGIEAFPGYAPLESQIRTVRSFQRPVVLVDDLLHSGNRLKVLDPLFRREGLDIRQVLVGLLSGRGRDLMAAKGREVDSVYFVPDLRSWFVESTMYPFIGGDAVSGAKKTLPGLTPSVNLILPYAFPRFYKECAREAVFRFSQVCLQNSRDILLALENAYRARYARNLTLSRLGEAVILPLAPDKGGALRYAPSLPASVCVDNDLKLLLRMRDLME